MAAAGSPYPPREERELTSGGDSGLTSWIRDSPDWSVTDSRTSLGDLSVLLETGGVDATHEGKALAYSPTEPEGGRWRRRCGERRNTCAKVVGLPP